MGTKLLVVMISTCCAFQLRRLTVFRVLVPGCCSTDCCTDTLSCCSTPVQYEHASSPVTCCMRISNICRDFHWVSDLCCMQSFTSQSTFGDAMIRLLQQLPRVQWIITTLGKKGSVLVEKASPEDAEEDAVLEDMLNKMLTEASSSSSSSSTRSTSGASKHGCVSSDSAACTSKTQVQIR